MRVKYFIILIFGIGCLLNCIFAQNAKNTKTPNIIILLDDINQELKKDLESYKNELIKVDNITLTAENIYFWANEWKTSFEKILKSQGYYDEIIEYIVGGEPGDGLNITYKIILNNQYTISHSEIKLKKFDRAQEINLPPEESLNFKDMDIAVAKVILVKQEEIQKFIEANNCLLNFQVSHQGFLDRDKHTLKILFLINTGPTAYISNVDFIDLKTIDPEYAAKLTNLKPGSCFTRSKIFEAQNSLQQSGLFLNIDSLIPTYPDEYHKVDVKFKIKEKKHHTIKAGVKYSTDIGAGISGSLENRNFSGKGENLTSNISVARPLQTIETIYKSAYFLKDYQTLKLQNTIKRENLDAYKNKEISVLAALEQNILSKLTIGEGVKYSVNKVTDDKKTGHYALLSFPLYAASDFRDNVLDPLKGALIKLEFTPYYNSIRPHNKFFKTQCNTSFYLGIDNKFKPTLAFKGQVGSIRGEKSTQLPANERFFSGGGGSVRGYSYKTLGPLNEKNDPVGGNSNIEISTELRIKLNQTIGVAGFIDGGNVFSSSSPKFKEKLLYSSGFGIRYYTSFGPIRADIAFPLDKRKKIDKSFQLYFSIGQAF